MNRQIVSVLIVAATLGGCAPQPPPQQLVVQRPDEQKPQTVTFPNGTEECELARRRGLPERAHHCCV